MLLVLSWHHRLRGLVLHKEMRVKRPLTARSFQTQQYRPLVQYPPPVQQRPLPQRSCMVMTLKDVFYWVGVQVVQVVPRLGPTSRQHPQRVNHMLTRTTISHPMLLHNTLTASPCTTFKADSALLLLPEPIPQMHKNSRVLLHIRSKKTQLTPPHPAHPRKPPLDGTYWEWVLLSLLVAYYSEVERDSVLCFLPIPSRARTSR